MRYLHTIFQRLQFLKIKQDTTLSRKNIQYPFLSHVATEILHNFTISYKNDDKTSDFQTE